MRSIDILLRVELPPMEEVPDWDAFEESAPGKWRLPGTPITIMRMDEGPRSGEYLFSATSVSDLPGFYNRISHLPLQQPSLFESWTETAPQLTGPLIPAAFVEVLPDFARKTALGTPFWKILLSVVALVVVVTLFLFLQRWMGRRAPVSPFVTMFRRMLIPIAGIALVWVLYMNTKNSTISGKSQPFGPQFTNGLPSCGYPTWWGCEEQRIFELAFMGLVK